MSEGRSFALLCGWPKMHVLTYLTRLLQQPTLVKYRGLIFCELDSPFKSSMQVRCLPRLESKVAPVSFNAIRL
jgi:hypothetical protein